MADSGKKGRVVIVGAGFAGFNAARELSRLAGTTTEIVVINSTDYFLYLPVARPAVLTLVLLSFLWTWNDYFLALVLVSDPAHQPITLGLGAFSGRYLVQINLLSAAAILVSLPVIVLSFVFQRQFIRGILSGAVKG